MASSHVLQLPLEHLRLRSSCTREKGAQRLGVNYNSASFSITDPEMPLHPLQINQDNHTALLDKATGRTNMMHSDGRTEKARDRQTPKHCREGQEKSGHSDTNLPVIDLICCPWFLVPLCVSIPCLHCHWVVLNHPSKAQLTHRGDSLPWEGC